jgi:exosortase
MRFPLAAALAGCMAWLYADIGRGLVVQWATSPEASYGAIILAVTMMVFWERRQRILTSAGSPVSWAGALVIVLGLSTYLAGVFSADLFTTRASFVIVVGGLIWLLAGTGAAAASVAPLLFLLLAIPLPELVVTTLTSSLQNIASRTAEVSLVMAGIPVYRDGNVLELPSATLQIVEACSGLRSVVSLASLGVLLAWASGGPIVPRAILIISAVPVAVLTNGMRVAASGAASETWGPAMLKDPWHTLAGWIAFLISLAILWAIRRALLGGVRIPAQYPTVATA